MQFIISCLSPIAVLVDASGKKETSGSPQIGRAPSLLCLGRWGPVIVPVLSELYGITSVLPDSCPNTKM